MRHKSKGWGPVAATLVTVGIYFGAQFIAAVCIGIFGRFRGYDGPALEKILKTSAEWQFSFFALFELISLAALWLFLRHRAIHWSDIGLKKPKISNILLALPVFGGYFVSLIVVSQLLAQAISSIDLDQKQDIGFNQATHGFAPLVLIFLALVVLTPVVEEILIRGFLYGGLRSRMPKLSAALVASVIFGIAHLQLGSNAPPLWVAAIDTFILSLFLIWLREKTGNLWAGIAVHSLKNCLAFATLFIFHVS